MKKRLFGHLRERGIKTSPLIAIGVCFTVLFSTLSISVSQAEENPYYFGPQGDISCPTPNNCTVLVSTEEGVVAYEGTGNTWKNGKVLDFMQDPEYRKVLKDNAIEGVNPIALTCLSPGNCEALLIGGQTYTEKRRKDDSLYLSFTTVKPYKNIYFSISQVNSKWQIPQYIKELSFTQNHVWHAFTGHASIHCSSHGNCLIAGNSGGPTEERIMKSIGKHVAGETQLDTKPFFISQVNGVWGTPQYPMVNKLQNRGAQFYTLKCKSQSNCVVQGGFVPSAAELLKLKKQNNVELKYESILYLGFTLSLENGKWGEPKPNLGSNFKKGPYPKGDPKVFFVNDPTGNRWNSPTNMMTCIKTYSCRIEPLQVEKLSEPKKDVPPVVIPPIQPAGVGDPTWPVKCPEVIDTVKAPQPKVLGFKFDGTGDVFTRLANGTSNASKEPSDIVGCYAVLNWFLPNSKNANGFHIGTISRDETGYYWENTSGVRWGLTLSGSTLTTDKDNPYYATGRQFITF